MAISPHDEALAALAILRRSLGQMEWPSAYGGTTTAADHFARFFAAVEAEVAHHRAYQQAFAPYVNSECPPHDFDILRQCRKCGLGSVREQGI